MKVKRYYDPGWPMMLRWKGSVIPHVITQTITVTIITAIVTVLYEFTSVKLSATSTPGSSNTFTQIIGIVVGLLLTYRTNTAYDRYWEGRKLWSTMLVQLRNFTRYTWIGVREDGLKKGDKTDGPPKQEVLIEKRTVLNLILGFAVAVKHYLREEPGCDHEDLKYLIASIQSNLPGFTPLSTQDRTCIRKAQKVGWFTRLLKPKKSKADEAEEDTGHNLPLDITLYLSSYVASQASKERIDVPTTNQLLAALGGISDCLSQFERILRSPIPLAYSIHLSQTVWVYCISLPFFLVSTAHFPTIIIVFFVSLILFGLEHIGTEIENPFGYDENDLELDDFCGHIKRELDSITSHPPPTLKDWVYTPENFPFENKQVSAIEASRLDPEEVRSLLSVKSITEDERNSMEIREENGEGSMKDKDNNREDSKKSGDNVAVDVSDK